MLFRSILLKCDRTALTELDELSTFAGSLVMNTHLKHPLDPHLYPKIVGYTGKDSIEVRIVLARERWITLG